MGGGKFWEGAGSKKANQLRNNVRKRVRFESVIVKAEHECARVMLEGTLFVAEVFSKEAPVRKGGINTKGCSAHPYKQVA